VNLVWHTLKKDIRQLRFVVSLWFAAIAVQTLLGAFAPSTTNRPTLWVICQMVAQVAPALQYLLLIVLIPLAIQQDPLADPRAFWLTRPISRRALLAGKALFLALVVIVPAVLGEVIVLSFSGLTPRLVLLAIPEVLLEVAARTFVIAVLAAFTTNFARFAVAGVCYLVGWGIASLFVRSLLSTLHSGASGGYGLSTGYLLSQKVAGTMATVAIGGGVLAWQYLTRQKRTAVGLALLGVLGIMVIRDVWPWSVSGGKVDATVAAKGPKSGDIEMALVGIKPYAGPMPEWKRWQVLTAAFSVHKQPRATVLEILSGNLALTPADGRTRNGWFTSDLSGFNSGLSAGAHALPAGLSEAAERDLGSIHILNPATNAAASVTGLHATLTTREPADSEACLGKKVAVTGDVEVAAYGYKLASIAALKSGACLSYGLDGDRILSVGGEQKSDLRMTVTESAASGAHADRMADDEGKATKVFVRRRIANLAFEPEKDADTMIQRMQPWQSTVYLLLNRGKGNEVVLCEAVNNNDVLFLMTMALRIMSPTRLGYCDAKLIFPPLTEDWLKGAELVCFKRTRLGTFHKTIDVKDFLVGAAETKANVEKSNPE